MFAFLPKLRSVIVAVMLVTLCFFSFPTFGSGFSCGTLDAQLKYAFQSGYTWVGQGITNDMLTTLWFVRFSDGNFIIIAVDDDLNACRVLEGYEFDSPVSGGA